jgi:hypothetical protein
LTTALQARNRFRARCAVSLFGAPISISGAWRASLIMSSTNGGTNPGLCLRRKARSRSKFGRGLMVTQLELPISRGSCEKGFIVKIHVPETSVVEEMWDVFRLEKRPKLVISTASI